MSNPDFLAAAPAFPVGVRATATRGPWTGLAGVIDPLSQTAAGEGVRILRVDKLPDPAPGTKKEPETPAQRFTPRSHLVVVLVRDLALEPGRTKKARQRPSVKESVAGSDAGDTPGNGAPAD
jgi:hypothetical protein